MGEPAHTDGRPNLFEVDLGAIAHAVRTLRRNVRPHVRIFAALKSNAYGFGMVPVARSVVEAGVDAISVVDRAHAIELRRHDVSIPLLVYANDVLDEQAVLSCQQWNLIPTVIDRRSAEVASRYANGQLRIAVKVDVGQERLGVPVEGVADFLEAVNGMPGLKVEVVNAHPFVPHEAPHTCVAQQYSRFVAACDEAVRRGVRIPTRLFASSKVLALTDSMSLDAVDPGHALFPPSAIKSLKSRLIQIREPRPHPAPGFSPFPVEKVTHYGVIPIGRSDGLLGCTAEHVLVRGQRCRLLGVPALEYARLDLSPVPSAEVGDEVVLIGQQGSERVGPQEVVQARGYRTSVDIAIALRGTVRRTYSDGG